MTTDNLYQSPQSDLVTEDSNELVYAGFWVRFFAALIDSICIGVVTVPLLSFIYGTEYWTLGSNMQGSMDFIITYIFPAAATVLFWVYKSATPGKMMLGLKVINLKDQQPLKPMHALGRYISYYPSMLFLCLGFIWVAFDDRKQGWHDKLANTAVVRV